MMQEGVSLQNDGFSPGLLALILDEQGATAIEYALIAALIVVGAMGALLSFSESTINLFIYWSNAVVNALSGG